MLFSALLGLIIRNHRTIYLKYLSVLPLLHQGADRSLGVGGGWWKRKCQETEHREVLLLLHPCVTFQIRKGFWSHLMAEPDLELVSPGLYFCSALWKRRGEVDVFTFRSPSLRPPNCSMQWLYFRCLILKTQGPYIGDR